jgi:hypothetical protein
MYGGVIFMWQEDINQILKFRATPVGEYFSWMPKTRRTRKQLGECGIFTPSLWVDT